MEAEAAAAPPADGAVNIEEVITLTEDGGVTKRILVVGSSEEEGPEKGDETYVHYTGTLTDGTKFDSSRDRNQPFSFKLGEGRVIKGWDVGVASMKKGEKCVLTCTSEYAYGATGSPPKIPGGATLLFEVELLSWDSHKDISGDGGVLKDVISKDADAGYEMPDGQDEVTVVYKVYLAGSTDVVDESPEGGASFCIASPGAVVLPGVVAAVKTMKAGEVARLALSPAYGYGDAGKPPSVPAGAKLTVELELKSWIKVEDVTGDGGVVRRVLSTPKSEFKTPNTGAKAVVSYTATLPDGTVFDEVESFECVVDAGNMPEGFDVALTKMKMGERDILTLQPGYAFGSAGRAGARAAVPPNTPVTYDVTLTSFESGKDTWDMSDADKVAAASGAKDRGNAAFKAGNLECAARCYDKATSAISYDKTFPDNVKAAARELRKSCHLNLAAVRVKQARWKDCVAACDKVLESDPDNIKGLFRRAQGYISMADFLEAELDIKRGLCIEPTNTDLVALSKKLKVEQKTSAKKESALYGKMFAAKPAPPAQPAQPEPTQPEPAQPEPAVV
ncbi:hypothetical protein FOA52_015566 [Chlamydomonas sp. UWO 241]|nr:hypothetical protein FOA52_015566 [Chlamydomonas sp. UWO 241]